MRLYAITNRSLLPGEHVRGQLSGAEHEGLLRLAEEWAAGGVEYVQLREKDLPAPVLTSLVREMAAAIAGRSRLLVNAGGLANSGDLSNTGNQGAREMTRVAGVDGLHLPATWTADQVGTARATGIVSVACHSLGEIAVARVARADLVLLSPIFPTETHPEEPTLGLDELAAGCREAGTMPVFALGGVNAESAEACLAAGAAGLAGIRMFMEGRWAEVTTPV